MKIIGEGTDRFAQGYFVLDSKKSGSVTVSHLRIASRPIRSTYLIGQGQATFVACHQFHFLDRMDVLGRAAPARPSCSLCPWSADRVWDYLPVEVQREIIDKGLSRRVVDAARVARDAGMGHRINTVMQPCFFALSGVLPRVTRRSRPSRHGSRRPSAAAARRWWPATSPPSTAPWRRCTRWRSPPGRPAPAIAARPCPNRRPTSSSGSRPACWRATATCCRSAPYPWTALDRHGQVGEAGPAGRRDPHPGPVGLHRLRQVRHRLPALDHPHQRVPAPEALEGAPDGFEAKDFAPATCPAEAHCPGRPGRLHRLRGLREVCPAHSKEEVKHKAINMTPVDQFLERERERWDFFLEILELDRDRMAPDTVKGPQLRQPLFEFSGACGGCGETQYLKLISQLFGDRLLVANATGCSSIYGGNLPTTPGRSTTRVKPAWPTRCSRTTPSSAWASAWPPTGSRPAPASWSSG